jgi:peroxiredoxin
MVTVGEQAPQFTVPKAGGAAYDDIEPLSLSEALENGPIVLAFYPAAFTSGCTEEMCTFRDYYDDFAVLDATVYGVSVDLPFAQNVWIQEHDLGFPMLSDWDHELVDSYDVAAESRGMELAERSVFVIDGSGEVVYRWVRDGENPDFETLVADVRAAVEAET